MPFCSWWNLFIAEVRACCFPTCLAAPSPLVDSQGIQFPQHTGSWILKEQWNTLPPYRLKWEGQGSDLFQKRVFLLPEQFLKYYQLMQWRITIGQKTKNKINTTFHKAYKNTAKQTLYFLDDLWGFSFIEFLVFSL